MVIQPYFILVSCYNIKMKIININYCSDSLDFLKNEPDLYSIKDAISFYRYDEEEAFKKLKEANMDIKNGRVYRGKLINLVSKI